MSNRIINTITISCVLLGSTAMAEQKPMVVEKIVAEYQSYITDYKSYPSARRSILTEHLVAAIEADKVSLAEHGEVALK